MNCPACGFKITKDFKFCPSCGSEIPKNLMESNVASAAKVITDKVIVCDVCGEENAASSAVCNSCGAKLNQKNTIQKTGSTQNVTVKKEEKRTNEKEYRKEEKGIKQRESKKSINPKVEIPKKNANLSPVNIIILVAGLLLLGYFILDLSGVFDSPEKTIQVNSTGTEGGSPQINLADLKRIEELEKTVLADSTRTDVILELAHKLGDSGFLEKAVKYYEMYLRQNPRNADVNVDLGVVFFELKQYNKAKSRMMQGLALNPSHQIAHFNIGVVNSSEGKLDSAKIWWKKAVDINPGTEIGQRAQELLNSH